MAKAFREASGRFQFRGTALEEAMNPVPADAVVVEFDEDTNKGLVADIQANHGQYAVTAGGVLQKAGSPVAPAADGDRLGLRRAAAQAVQGNDSYLALATPTNAQTAAQVRALTQQNTRLIRAVVKLLAQ